MRAFYLACFDMDLADEAEDYCVLESESLTLSLVVVPEHIAATIDVSVPPIRREGTPIKLAFGAVGIEALRPCVGAIARWPQAC
jgi:hypothetical protein